jgi:flavin-dependent dehydrogenase
VCWPHYLKTRDKPLAEFFADTIALSPPLAERLAGAELIDAAVHATGNYSYSATRAHGERYLLLGDAYAFIDPVFSSGVYFAMASAFAGADLIATCLDRPAQEAAARRRFAAQLEKGPREFSWFIYRMTNPAMRELFMYPRNPLRVKEALLSLLAGDIYGDTPIWRSLRVLKGLYYLASLGRLGQTLGAWRARRRNIRHEGPIHGENVIVDT